MGAITTPTSMRYRVKLVAIFTQLSCFHLYYKLILLVDLFIRYE